MRDRMDAMPSSTGKLDAVRSWGRWSIGDCFLASYIFSLQCSLRRFKRSEILAKKFPYVALFVDQLSGDYNFTAHLGAIQRTGGWTSLLQRPNKLADDLELESRIGESLPRVGICASRCCHFGGREFLHAVS